MPFEMEMENSEETQQATVPARSRRSAKDLQDQLDSTGHAFTSDNVFLEIKTSHCKKRLLDGMDSGFKDNDNLHEFSH